jgi:hypothetical protein
MVTASLAFVFALRAVVQDPAAPSVTPAPTSSSAHADLPSLSTSTSTSTTVSTPSSEFVPGLDDCRVLVDAGRLAEARVCYKHVAAVDAAHAPLARALADLVAPAVPPDAPASTPRTMPEDDEPSPPSPTPSSSPTSPLSLDSLAWHGRGELIGSAVLTGGAASVAALGTLPVAMGSQWTALALAAPVLGGATAGAVTTAALLALPQLRDGDVHLVRAGVWTGAFDAACVGAALASVGGSDGHAVAASMLLTWAAVSGVSVAGAALVDVDDAAPSLGLSFVWIGALSTGLGFAMADLPADYPANPWPRVAATVGVIGTAAGLGGVIAGNALHLTRASVWLVDVGAGAGALSAYALATGLRAGTPALGWGTVLTGTLLGAGAGLFAARQIGAATDAGTSSPIVLSPIVLPSIVLSPIVLSPSMLPVVVEGGRVDVVPGAVLSGSFR